ncbi:uncharacterized protein MONBRDRAFT_26444 [Monosiga brevicollis MX1]|uniref:phenylalanine--tRNA ligase n=1 Tax=Monosiga brevicollis TaxID=81824 RepID=A9V2D8_MONBE|nr:uncharacterized protein MONBRDRAFT_26444 [Monosiga brevicollis MX1]EDQ88240.1 predicted protein [Monosiga brevicollis MX1]|eukprot:XP_001746833.1 hypothetical protein [Monosiga brevicollis MX1]
MLADPAAMAAFARRAIVNGDVEPTDEEAQWPPAGAEGEEPEPEEDNEDDEDDEEDPNAHHLDKFWFACLCNNPQISQLIMEHDEAVLEYLTDISGEYKEPGLTGFTLTFTFRENPYFTNTTISKTYNLAPGPEEDDELEYNGPIFQSAVADPINWKEGMDVTVKSVTKKQRKKTGKNKGDTRTVTKSVPQESFFHFFTPPQLNPEEASEEEIQTAAELLNTDYLIGEVFLNDIIPKAVLWYTGEAEFSSDDEEEEEEEEDDYEDEDDDDEDDPDYVPPAGGQAPECKQSGPDVLVLNLRAIFGRAHVMCSPQLKCNNLQSSANATMPTISINRDDLHTALGRSYTQKEFEDLCFDFGLELDEVTSEKEELEKSGSAKAKDASEAIIYKIDIPANRCILVPFDTNHHSYDLLCIEGLVRGLKIFLNKMGAPQYQLKGEPKETMTITANTAAVRPFGVAAVLRNVNMTQKAYDSFIDLQEKLHQNICRRRTLVAIGTHDLDTIKGPFTYDAQKPEDVVFKPLRVPDAFELKEYNAKELLTMYQQDLQLKQYLHILEKEPLIPVIRDANGVVLSMPPIINGDHSRISTATKNIFIECTATDLTKAKIVLDIIVTMFSEHCAEPFTIEPVNVVNPDGKTVAYPALSTRTTSVQAEDIYRRMGIKREQADPAKLAELLTRMQLTSSLDADQKTISVQVPPTRADVLHPCDIWEDAAIAFGFNNIEWTEPAVSTSGKQQPINKLADQLRRLLVEANYTEALTFALCKHDDNFASLRRPDDGKTAAVISNPKTQDFQVCRSNLLSGLLRTVHSNLRMPLPIKVFEVSDVVLLNPAAETGASNHRRLAAVQAGKSAGFEAVQGLLDLVMQMLEVPRDDQLALKPDGRAYTLRPSQDPAFFGQLGAADIIFRGARVGVLGVVHPEVLANYNLKLAASALELELEFFL